MSWKKYIILSISAIGILCAAKFAYSCFIDRLDYGYPAFFGTSLPGKVAYRPFFYVEDSRFYDLHDANEDYIDLLNAANIKEWQSFAGAGIPSADIDSVLNQFPVQDLINISKGRVGAGKNVFAHWLAGPKHKGVLDYLIYAKQCEPYAAATDWDTLRVNADSSEILINKGLDAFTKANDGFLRIRYAFQIIRLAFYNKQNERALELYNKLIGDTQDSCLSFARCMGCKAGVYYRQKKYAQAAYWYSRMFEASDGLKRTAMTSFLWCIDNEGSNASVTDSAMGLCRNNHERAVFTIMQALLEYGKALPLVQKAYQLDPTIEGIDVVVNREINKMEERYQADNIYKANGTEFENYLRYFEGGRDGLQERMDDSLRKTYPGYLGKLNGFIQQMIVGKTSGRKAYWHLASAYIQYMLHNTAQMQAEMQLADAAKMNTEEQKLYHIILVLYAIENHNQITPALEEELLPQLQALDKLAITNLDENDNFSNIMNYLLAPKYLQQKDTSKALYCMAHSRYARYPFTFGEEGRNSNVSGNVKYFVDVDYQDRPGLLLDRMGLESLQKVLAFEANKNSSPFNSWLVTNTYYNANTLGELEATKYIRIYNFRAAEKILANIPHLDSLPFPYELRINDYEDTVYRQDTSLLNNKYTFAKQMADLQDSIAKKPNSAPLLYKYALGLYGMSYYGRSPHLFTYYHGSVDEYKYYKTKERDGLPDVFQEYYGLYAAEKYFNLAEKAATTATLKAKCLFGAAKCWQKRCPRENNSDYNDSGYVAYSLSNPYFSILKTEYSTNAFTKELYNTCSYFRDYVKKAE
jgi:hypothetical protein